MTRSTKKKKKKKKKKKFPLRAPSQAEARSRFGDREGASSAPIFRRGGCPPTLNSWLQRPGGAAVAVTAADAISAAATPFPASTILPRGEEGVTVPNHYYYHNDMMTMMHLYP